MATAGREEDDIVSVRPLVRPRLYEQLMMRLLELADERGLTPGDRLPPERVLSQGLQVSRASLRQAIVALEVQGLVEVRHGDGIYLRRPATTPRSLSELLERRQRLPEILEAREALEVKIAEIAAQRRTEDDLASMERALQHMRDEIDAGELGADADAEFHRAVTLAAHNTILARLMEFLDDPVRETRLESLSQPGRPPQSLAGHELIAAAISEGDLVGAAEAMRAHLKVVADVRLLTWNPEGDMG